MHRSVHARRLAREALDRAPPPAARAANGDHHVGGADRVRAALAALADRHLARREVVALDASHGDPRALLTSLEADVPTLAVPSSGGIAALADAVEGRRIEALHLFCAGTNGTLNLGGEPFSPLRPSVRHRAGLARLAAALSAAEGRPILHLYGSTFGTGGEGRAAARALGRALGAGIAATRDDGSGGNAQPEWHVELPPPDGGVRRGPDDTTTPSEGAPWRNAVSDAPSREHPKPAAIDVPTPFPSGEGAPDVSFAIAGDPFSVLGGFVRVGTALPRIADGVTERAAPHAVPSPVATEVRSERDSNASTPAMSTEREEAAPFVVRPSGTHATPPRVANPPKRSAGLAVRALSVEAWFRADAAVGERTVAGGPSAPRLVLDGPRLVLTVPTPAGERRAVADLSRLGIEDASARLVHAIGTVREDWACLYVEGALAATARLEGGEREWSVPPRGPRTAGFEGELGLARLYTRALAGREVLANHRATRGDGKATAGALWSIGPLTSRSPGPAGNPAEDERNGPSRHSDEPRPGSEASANAETHASLRTAPSPSVAPASESAGSATGSDVGAADPRGEQYLGDNGIGSRVRRREAPAMRPDPFGPRVTRVGEPPVGRLPRRAQRELLQLSRRAGVAPVVSGDARADVVLNQSVVATTPIPATGDDPERSGPASGSPVSSRVRRTGARSAPTPVPVPEYRDPAALQTVLHDAEPQPTADEGVSSKSEGATDGEPVEAPVVTPAPEPVVENPAPIDAVPDHALPAERIILRAMPGEALHLDVAELAGCALIDAVAHWPVSLPDWLSLDGCSGVVSGTTPARAEARRERIVVTAANAHGATAMLAIEIEVAASPDDGPQVPDALDTFEAAMRTATDAIPALRALLHSGKREGRAGA